MNHRFAVVPKLESKKPDVTEKWTFGEDISRAFQLFFEVLSKFLFPNLPDYYPIRKKIYITKNNSVMGLIWDIIQGLCSIFLCVTYVFRTYYSGNYSANSYVFSIGTIITQIFMIDFLLNWYLVNSFSYFLEFFTLIDIVVLFGGYVIFFFNSQYAQLEFLRCFRIIRLHRISHGLKAVRNLSRVRRQIITLVLTLLMMIFLSAGVVQIMENNVNQYTLSCQYINQHTGWEPSCYKNSPSDELDCDCTLNNCHPLYFYSDEAGKPTGIYCSKLDYFDAFYFMVITVTTVGYGDISPTTNYTRIVVIIFIITSLVVIPMNINEIQVLLSLRSPFRSPYIGRDGEHHVILCGHVNNRAKLESFFAEFFHPDRVSSSGQEYVVVILSPCEPTEDVRSLLQKPPLDSKVTYVIGSALSTEDLKRVKAESASCMFFLCNAETNETLTNEEDAGTVLRALSVSNFNPNLECLVQVLRPEERVVLKDSDIDVILCLDEFKTALQAKNAICPGFSTFIENIFHSLESISEDQETKLAPWYLEYLHGAGMELYFLKLSMQFVSRMKYSFRRISEALYIAYGVSVLGLSNQSFNGLVFNPSAGDLAEFPDAASFFKVFNMALVMASDQHEADEISNSLQSEDVITSIIERVKMADAKFKCHRFAKRTKNHSDYENEHQYGGMENQDDVDDVDDDDDDDISLDESSSSDSDCDEDNYVGYSTYVRKKSNFVSNSIVPKKSISIPASSSSSSADGSSLPALNGASGWKSPFTNVMPSNTTTSTSSVARKPEANSSRATLVKIRPGLEKNNFSLLNNQNSNSNSSDNLMMSSSMSDSNSALGKSIRENRDIDENEDEDEEEGEEDEEEKKEKSMSDRSDTIAPLSSSLSLLSSSSSSSFKSPPITSSPYQPSLLAVSQNTPSNPFASKPASRNNRMSMIQTPPKGPLGISRNGQPSAFNDNSSSVGGRKNRVSMVRPQSAMRPSNSPLASSAATATATATAATSSSSASSASLLSSNSTSMSTSPISVTNRSNEGSGSTTSTSAPTTPTNTTNVVSNKAGRNPRASMIQGTNTSRIRLPPIASAAQDHRNQTECPNVLREEDEEDDEDEDHEDQEDQDEANNDDENNKEISTDVNEVDSSQEINQCDVNPDLNPDVNSTPEKTNTTSEINSSPVVSTPMAYISPSSRRLKIPDVVQGPSLEILSRMLLPVSTQPMDQDKTAQLNAATAMKDDKKQNGTFLTSEELLKQWIHQDDQPSPVKLVAKKKKLKIFAKKIIEDQKKAHDTLSREEDPSSGKSSTPDNNNHRPNNQEDLTSSKKINGVLDATGSTRSSNPSPPAPPSTSPPSSTKFKSVAQNIMKRLSLMKAGLIEDIDMAASSKSSSTASSSSSATNSNSNSNSSYSGALETSRLHRNSRNSKDEDIVIGSIGNRSRQLDNASKILNHVIVYGGDANIHLFITELRRPIVQGDTYHPIVVVGENTPSLWNSIKSRFNDIFFIKGDLASRQTLLSINLEKAFSLIILAARSSLTKVEEESLDASTLFHYLKLEHRIPEAVFCSVELNCATNMSVLNATIMKRHRNIELHRAQIRSKVASVMMDPSSNPSSPDREDTKVRRKHRSSSGSFHDIAIDALRSTATSLASMLAPRLSSFDRKGVDDNEYRSSTNNSDHPYQNSSNSSNSSASSQSSAEESDSDRSEDGSPVTHNIIASAFFKQKDSISSIRSHAEKELWESFNTHHVLPVFASARAFVPSSFESLLVQSFYAKLTPIICEKFVCGQLQQNVLQIEIPGSLVGKKYVDVHRFFINHYVMCIGLYRAPRQKMGASLPYVYTSPPSSTRIYPNDRLYVFGSAKRVHFALQDAMSLR